MEDGGPKNAKEKEKKGEEENKTNINCESNIETHTHKVECVIATHSAVFHGCVETNSNSLRARARWLMVQD